MLTYKWVLVAVNEIALQPNIHDATQLTYSAEIIFTGGTWKSQY